MIFILDRKKIEERKDGREYLLLHSFFLFLVANSELLYRNKAEFHL